MGKTVIIIGLAMASILMVATDRAVARPRTIENADLKYSVTIPSECRTEEGPGTLEAICSPDFDEAKSAELPAAAALLLEIDAETAPAGAQVYGETDFKRELPEAVCGESDTSKVRLSAITETKDGATTNFTATVICSEIKFLGLPERQAKVRYVIQPGFRYRLMARALSSDAEMVKAATETFLTTFKSSAEVKP